LTLVWTDEKLSPEPEPASDMKVLAANKFYFVKGGAERYYFELKRILEERGHEVVPFAMRHEENEPSEHEDLFVSHESFEGARGLGRALSAAGRVIYSVESRRKIEELVDRTKPDVAHLHNIAHQLSPSILYGLRAKGVPVVQTLHDYKLVCPNYQMFVHGEVCERCATWRYYNAVIHCCMRGSVARSLTVCAEAYVHRLLGTYARNVALFIAPSESLRKRVIAHGVDPAKVVHLPYGIALDAYTPRYESDGYAVYVGRLSTGKGLRTLLRAAARAPGVRLRVVGSGPLSAELAETAQQGGLSNVSFEGYRTGPELAALFSGSRFVVVPSECYENSPLTVYEALAYGKAVIGSAIGGIPELVAEGVNGLLFDAGDDAALAEAMTALWSDASRAIAMGRAGRERIEREFAPGQHYERIMAIYERVLR
jgi:glycosyltransferase involved in cell wall biosynthesis